MNTKHTLTDRLIAHTHDTWYEHLPPETIRRARWVMLDTLVTALGGTDHSDFGHCLRVLGTDQNGAASVWGTTHRTAPDKAAFLNAFLVHNNEYDPLHERAVVHVPATVLPALIAQAQLDQDITGERLLSAFCVAVDVAVTVGLAHGAPMRFFRPAMAGAIGAAAGVAHLMALDAGGIRRAMSLTASQVSGTLQAHTEGTSTLAWQMGVNARGAWLAAQFAKSGMSAPWEFLEGPFGFLASFDGAAREAVDGCQLGREWAVDELSHKPYPSGRATHAAIDAIRSLHAERPIAPAAVSEIQVVVPPLAWHLAARPVLPEMSTNYARLCLPYAVSLALLHGSVRLSDFRFPAFNTPDVQALAQKVRPVLDPDRDHDALAPVTVHIDLSDGRRISKTVESMRGSPDHPFSQDDMEKKATQCLANLASDPQVLLRDLSYAINSLDERPAAPALTAALEVVLTDPRST